MVKEKQSVKVNLIYQICYQILTILLPFVTAPYISRILGAENVGIYSYTYTIASYFVQFAALGINNHGSRVIAQVKDNQNELNKAFSDLFTTHLIVSLFTFVVYAIYMIGFSRYPSIAIAQGFIVFGAVLDINWFFFGMEKFKLTVTRNIIIKLVTVGCVFVFVNNRDDLLIYTVIMSSGTMISQSVVWLFLRENVSFVKPDIKSMINHSKNLLVMFVAVIAVSLYRTMAKVMLGVMADMSQVGCYENADKLIMYPVSFITALGTIMLPRMSHLYKNGNVKGACNTLDLSVDFVMMISSAMCFGLIAVANDFSVMFYGSEFALTGDILSITAITIPFMAINNVLRTQYIIPTNQDGIYLKAVLLGALFNLILNAILIPIYGARGATVGTVSADAIVFVYQMMSLRKELPVKEYLLKSVYPLMAGIAMCHIVKMVSAELGNNFTYVLIQIGIGIVSYIVLMFPYIILSKKSKVAKYIRDLLLKRFLSR